MRTGMEILLAEEETGIRRDCTSSISTSETMIVKDGVPWEYNRKHCRWVVFKLLYRTKA